MSVAPKLRRPCGYHFIADHCVEARRVFAHRSKHPFNSIAVPLLEIDDFQNVDGLSRNEAVFVMTEQIVLIVPLMYIVLQWTALSRMRNGWHVAALMPAVFMLAALVLMVVGLLANVDVALLALMIGLPLATAYLLILWPLHFVLGPPNHS